MRRIWRFRLTSIVILVLVMIRSTAGNNNSNKSTNFDCIQGTSISVSVKSVGSYSTYGNAGFEYFAVGSKPFMAIANFWDGTDMAMGAHSEIVPIKQDIETGLLTMDSSSSMRLWTQGAHGVDYFEVPLSSDVIRRHRGLESSSRRFLVFPNYYGCEGANKRPCKSTVILIWNDKLNQFEFLQSLLSDGPSQSDHFSIPHVNAHYLVVADNFANKVAIYRYHESTNVFVQEQLLYCPGVAAIAVAVLDDRVLLSAASYYDQHSQWQTRSPIFTWHFSDISPNNVRSNFQLVQELETQGAHDVEIIAYQNEKDHRNRHVLMFFSEDRNQYGPHIDSQLFKYDFQTNQFQLIQSIPTDGAHAAEMFIIEAFGEKYAFLAVANFGDRHGKRYHADSVLMMFSDRHQMFVQLGEGISTIGATDWEYFELNGHHYIAVSNEGDLQDQSDASESSEIFEIVIHQCGDVEKNIPDNHSDL